MAFSISIVAGAKADIRRLKAAYRFLVLDAIKRHLRDRPNVEEGDKKILVTHHGKPRSVVIGVEGYGLDEVMLMLDPSFWKMIESRRKQSRTSLAEFERELALEKSKPVRQRRGRVKKAG